MYPHLSADKNAGQFPDSYSVEVNMYQTGGSRAQHLDKRKKFNEKKLRAGMTVPGIVGSAPVWMRVSDKLPVNNMGMDKTRDARHVTAKERQ
jgi:hypothetical protein